MRLSSLFVIAGTFFAAAILCVIAARFSVSVVEENSRNAVRDTLDRNEMTWTEVDTSGLQIYLAGTAPSEATRFKALSIAGTVVDAARVIDQMLVEDTAGIAPPRFSVEILRNDRGISLIGLVPASTDRETLIAEVTEAAGEDEVTDLLESADHPEPGTWKDALDFAVDMLGLLPRAKISVDAERVEVTAMAESEQDKRKIESELARNAPDELRLALAISAPRPVITPFTLRFLIEDGKARFDACSADTEEARDRILHAAGQAGLDHKAECTIGLGVPSPHWAGAAEMAIEALGELGDGSITISDADITLVATEGTPEPRFDNVVGRLENRLPQVFALHAVLPEPEDTGAPAVPEFVATLSPEGLVQIRGRLDSARTRKMVDSFAKARFASDVVHTTARVANGLPKDWTLRMLTALESLSYLSSGAVTMTPDMLTVTGNTGRKGTNARIAGFLSEKLGEKAQFSIDVTYQETLDPEAGVPTPEECEMRIAEIQLDNKISFEPGSSQIDDSGGAIMDEIAGVLRECGEIRLEIGGHTDSQGREVMNQQLSQARAQTVLNELRQRRVLTASITARGYGESDPIADNDSEDGREANRRIEFRLIRPKPVAEHETTLEAMETPAEDNGAPAEDERIAEEEQEEQPDEQN